MFWRFTFLWLAIGVWPVLDALRADDWPQWRGPTRDGVWRETGIAEILPQNNGGLLSAVWEYPISAGYSGPTVAQGRVFVTDRVREPVQQERIHCVNMTTGKREWMHAYDCMYQGVGYEAGPRASVSIDEGLAYALGSMGDLHCLNVELGEVVWRRDLLQEYQVEMPIWGISASPLVYQDRLIVHIGGQDAGLVALDKKTGKELWKALPDKASYSAPVIHSFHGKTVVVAWTADSVSLLAPDTGKVHARYAFPPSRMAIGAATPVVDGDRIFVSSFYDGSLMLRVTPELGLEKVWREIGASETNTKALHCMISTPIFEGGYLYGVDSYGELRCLNANTGERIWEDLTAVPKARWSCIHLVRREGRCWMFNERGQLVVAELSPKGLKEISRAAIIAPTMEQLNMRGGVCWSHPAFANRCVFARNDGKLVCVNLAAIDSEPQDRSKVEPQTR